MHPRDNDDDDDDDVIDSRSVLFVTRMSATPPPPPADNADKEDGGNDDAYHDIPDSSIDWNKSWADFQASGGQSTAPVGREPLSREERTRRKMVNQMRDVTESLPTRQQLFADWRFWVALILVLSLFTAFVNSTTAPVTTI